MDRADTTICADILTNDDGHSSILANDLLPALDLMINMRIGVSIAKAVCAHIQLAGKSVKLYHAEFHDNAAEQAVKIPPTPGSFPQSSIEQ